MRFNDIKNTHLIAQKPSSEQQTKLLCTSTVTGDNGLIHVRSEKVRRSTKAKEKVQEGEKTYTVDLLAYSLNITTLYARLFEMFTF